MAIEATLSKGRPKGTGKKSIVIKTIEQGEQKYVAFSKRRKGLFKKAGRYFSMTGFKNAIIVFSPTNRIHCHGKPSFNKIFENYLKFIKKSEPRKEEEKKEAGRVEIKVLLSSLQAIQLEEHDDVEALVNLKEILQEIKEKAGKQIGGNNPLISTNR